MSKHSDARLANAIIGDLESLIVTEGVHQDKPLKVLGWQKKFVRGVTRHTYSALSVARSNGKTTLCAGIACSALMGALSVPRGQVILTAASFGQAKIAFRHVKFFMRPITESNRRLWRIADNNQYSEIENRETGVFLKCIGSNPDKAYGLAPSLVLADEPSYWLAGGRDMQAALSSAMGKQTGARMIALGTRPAGDDHWFAEMLESKSSAIYVQVHAAQRDDPDFAPDTIRRANPSYHHMPALRRALEIQIELSENDPNELAKWRALHLNLGTPETTEREPIVSLEDWRAVVTLDPPARAGGVCIGFDLGGGLSMTAAAFYWPECGRLELYGGFPGSPNLIERGKADHVGQRYLRMAETGEIKVYAGKVMNNVKFLEDVLERIEGEEIIGLAADRYKRPEVDQALFARGLDLEVEYRVVGKGPSGSEDVIAFRCEVLESHLSSKPSILMESAIAESEVRHDSNNNPGLHKLRKKGRNDALQAALLAVGMGRRWRLPTGEENTLEGYYGRLLSDEAPGIIGV